MKIILGNGLSAKIFQFYNPEYTRIAPAAGAQSDVASFQHSLILPKCKACDEFLADLDISSSQLDITIGYFKDGKYNQGEPPDDVKRDLMKKKLSGHERPPSLFPAEDILAGPYVSGDRGLMHTYHLSAKTLLDLLHYRLAEKRVINRKVVSISEKQIVLDNDKALEYSHLVSTIPANVFWKIYEGPHAEHKVLMSFPLYTGTMSDDQWLGCGYPELPEESMVYFPEEKFGFDRVRRSKVLQGDVIAIEGSLPFQDSIIMPGARILRSHENIAPPNVMFLGRYGEWNPDITMKAVIQRSSNKFFMESIFSDQKAFNRKFVSYAPDLEAVQRAAKNYVLHLFSESNDFLDTINWKFGSKPGAVKLDRERILEELTDIFKFLLSIYLLFGFDTADFEKMYWEKSAKVVEKYK